MIITIDGLGVNGKSTLAKMIARKLNIQNFNTGAIYRCIALKIIKNNMDINNITSVIEKVKNIDIFFDNEKTYLEGVDVSKDIRTEQISIFSTKWATIAEIKNIVRTIQKEFIKKYDTVMEGRDIGTLIAPNADYKFYLYSDFETRVNRLWNEDKTKDISTIRKELTIRDNLDINGGNFIKPENSIEIDTTNYSIEEVYNIMISKIIIN